MAKTIRIGTYHEPGREINRCPSYYAADHETLETIPGNYDLRLTFEGGYTIPMPYWLLVGIPTTRKSGRLYSGFGGLNFASTELKAGERVEYVLQTYEYLLRDLVAQGRVTLDPGFEWMIEGEGPSWNHEKAIREWSDPRLLTPVERVEKAIAHPDFSHATRRSWCGREILYLYNRNASSPSGVLLEESVEATPETLAAVGRRVPYGPTRGDLAGRS